MQTLSIHCSKSYNILIGQGLLDQAGEIISPLCPDSKLCVITDSNVKGLYGGDNNPLYRSLKQAGHKVFEYVFPAGEANKTMTTIEGILDFLAAHHFDRNDVLIALGGGVTGDMTGFAAAIYMRGIRFIQIPTTLLACVDSSIGGKTGVDLPAGKNLAGAFWHPELVVIDPAVFATLTPNLWRDGLAEMIKAGMIADASILQDLAGQTETVAGQDEPFADSSEPIRNLTSLIVKALQVKAAIVEADEREAGQRQLLNFGHTIGHAIEECSNFAISHGHAVAIGSVLAAAGAERLGWSAGGNADLLRDLLLKYGYDLDPGFDAPALANAALSDKKRRGDQITIVYPVRPGNCKLKLLPIDDLQQFIAFGLDYLMP